MMGGEFDAGSAAANLLAGLADAALPHIPPARHPLLMQKLSILARNCKALIRQTLSRKEVGEVPGGRGAQHIWI